MKRMKIFHMAINILNCLKLRSSSRVFSPSPAGLSSSPKDSSTLGLFLHVPCRHRDKWYITTLLTYSEFKHGRHIRIKQNKAKCSRQALSAVVYACPFLTKSQKRVKCIIQITLKLTHNLKFNTAPAFRRRVLKEKYAKWFRSVQLWLEKDITLTTTTSQMKCDKHLDMYILWIHDMQVDPRITASNARTNGIPLYVHVHGHPRPQWHWSTFAPYTYHKMIVAGQACQHPHPNHQLHQQWPLTAKAVYVKHRYSTTNVAWSSYLAMVRVRAVAMVRIMHLIS